MIKRLVCWLLQFTREGLAIFFSLYCRGSMHCQNSLFMCIRMVTSKLLPSLTQQEGNLDCHLTVSIIYLFYLTTCMVEWLLCLLSFIQLLSVYKGVFLLLLLSISLVFCCIKPWDSFACFIKMGFFWLVSRKVCS